MRRRASGALPGPVVQVRDRIEKWRRSRRGRSRMPESLWAAAAAIARVHGVNRVAKAAGLAYYSLKHRVEEEGEKAEEQAGPVFVELEIGRAMGTSRGSECEIELEGGPRKVTIRLRSADVGEISRLVSGLLGEGR